MARKSQKAVLVVHGGAGVIRRSLITPALERRYRAALERALRTGYAKLQKGQSSLDAVEAAVRVLEDSPLFNAGKGAVFTHDGRIELDAALMNGKTHAAGAVSCVNCVKNPISAARAVMERSAHVLMIGAGANRFIAEVANDAGLKLVDESYFFTERRWKALQRLLEAEKASQKASSIAPGSDRKFGTVGAVAVDQNGDLAAATSTGGITGKRYGRTGDTPIVGAGTYADNATAAISCTGQGEHMMRNVTAYDVAALIKYKGLTLKQASKEALATLSQHGGEGGLIALDKRGNLAMPFNSEGMFRGYITKDGTVHIEIFRH